MWHTWERGEGFGRGGAEGKNHTEDLDVDGWIILKWVFKKWYGDTWTGLIWVKKGTGGGLL
jgi:hypothetical protein